MSKNAKNHRNAIKNAARESSFNALASDLRNNYGLGLTLMQEFDCFTVEFETKNAVGKPEFYDLWSVEKKWARKSSRVQNFATTKKAMAIPGEKGTPERETKIQQMKAFYENLYKQGHDIDDEPCEDLKGFGE